MNDKEHNQHGADRDESSSLRWLRKRVTRRWLLKAGALAGGSVALRGLEDTAGVARGPSTGPDSGFGPMATAGLPRIVPMVNPGVAMTLVTRSSKLPEVPGGPNCRFAGEPVRWVHVSSGTGIRAFASSAVRVYSGVTGDGAPFDEAWTLFELSPLTAFAPGFFRNLSGGLPVQYVVARSSEIPAETPEDNIGLGFGNAVLTAGDAGAWFGLCFQDRIVRDPAAWAVMIDRALESSGTISAEWASFQASLRSIETEGPIYLVDHIGRPMTSGTVSISVDNASPVSISLTEALDGNSGVLLPVGSRATVTFTSAEHPIVAGAEYEGGAFEGAYELQPDERLVQLLDAHNWFTPVTVLADRWRPNSHVEPIVDGTPYFERLVEDLRSAKRPGLNDVSGSVHFAGWAFETSGSDGLPWSLKPGDETTEFLRLIDELRSSEVTVSFFVDKLIADETSLDDLDQILVVLAVFYIAFANFTTYTPWLTTDIYGFALMIAAIAAIAWFSDDIEEALKEFANNSEATVEALRSEGVDLVYAKYPAGRQDNPIAAPSFHVFLGSVTFDDVQQFGSYHTKGVIIQPAEDEPVAYLGGIDINGNRVDTPLHHTTSPYHDAQVRLRGPAVMDVARTFADTFQYVVDALPDGQNQPEFRFDLTAAERTVRDETTHPHLVQIGRTFFRPGTGSSTEPFAFAPDGETTIRDTLFAAIAAARDFIYIEDQYFTPGDDYVEVLLEAANGPARALVITVQPDAGQPFGGVRRDGILAALRTAWGDRLKAGAPIRRYRIQTPDSIVSEGRCRTVKPIAQADPQITIGPIARLPVTPFWVFVEGELIRVDATFGPPDTNIDGQTFEVIRGDAWGATIRPHEIGVPVTVVLAPGIFVHSKLMIVDDVFLSLGSANLNRRSLFFDGEANCFVIPQHLRRDPGNPAMTLRCRLWAEHFGLSPEIGLSLLADPLSALHYFDRPWFVGNRWQPLTWRGPKLPDIALSVSDSIGLSILQSDIVAEAALQRSELWATAIDPTSESDPNADDAHKGPRYTGAT